MAVNYTINDLDPVVLVLQVARDLRTWADTREMGEGDEELVDLIESLENWVARLV